MLDKYGFKYVKKTQKTVFARKNLCDLRASIQVAKEMGKELGVGEIL